MSIEGRCILEDERMLFHDCVLSLTTLMLIRSRACSPPNPDLEHSAATSHLLQKLIAPNMRSLVDMRCHGRGLGTMREDVGPV